MEDKMTGSTKVVRTPEELKEAKRMYMREYMKTYNKNRRNIDPEYVEKVREYKRNCEKKKCDNDPEYRKKKGDDFKARYAKYRDAYLKGIEEKSEN